MLEIGSIVDGKYKILNKIGQGGMSVVYLAMNERANKQWAIKEIRKDGTQNFEVVKQGLIAETGILKKLHHPNLPSIIDVIEDGDTFLIVMDYIEGNTLEKYLKTYGAQKQEDVIEWAKQLCDVLGYLHSRVPPIIYRDMKPSNVMLRPDGRVALIDFGTAREFKNGNVADTTCLGTKGYAAPEQYGDRGQTDARTDIYCLGATLYHLVTGHNPANPPYEMRPIREWNPMLSSGLEALILKCTKADPDERYQNCAELMYALENYQEFDEEKKRARNIRWRTFLAVSVSAVVFAGGAAGFKTGENICSRNTYDMYLSQLEHESSTEKSAELIENAINVDPSRPEAYNALLELFYAENDAERNLSQDEMEVIDKVINENHGEQLSNIDYFRKENRKEYCRFCYDLGSAIYFGYNSSHEQGSNVVDQSRAAKWFKNAVTANALEGDELKDAVLMKEFSENYQTMLIMGGNKLNNDGTRSIDYDEYWGQIKKLADSVENENNHIKKAEVIKFVSALISTRSNEFKKSGINLSDQQDLLERIQSMFDGLKQDAEGEGIDKLIEKTENAIIAAKSRLSIANQNTSS
ncbi:MAG: serine/threonine protein kinase [Porcipelethomonas sp.]